MSVVERLGGEDTGRENSVGKVAVASTIGATIEWYDFFLYGTAAGLIFNQLFFPPGNPTAGTLAAYATFAAGFVARPVGGFIFGHFGDRIGRKTMLVLTLLIMGVATFAIGLVPTYAQVGIWAPIILLTLRVLQGIGLGGEWGGAVLMAVEHAPEGRRGFFGSWPQLGVGAGLLLGTAAFSVLSLVMPEEAFLSWGWRVAFLASGVLVAVGMYIRLQIMESPAFTEIKESSSEARVPFLERPDPRLRDALRQGGKAACVRRWRGGLRTLRHTVLPPVQHAADRLDRAGPRGRVRDHPPGHGGCPVVVLVRALRH
jgi:MHS family shikimate/dehydroshikimate transporter-like MFS transporter